MNKLILIGNGFDKAHGLPTSYGDFIDDFWTNIHLNYQNDEYKKIVYINSDYNRVLNFNKKTESFKDFEDNLISYQEDYREELLPYESYRLGLRNNNKIVFKFENNFFKQISIKDSLQNWVDIENEYYFELKKIVKTFDLRDQPDIQKKAILKLNNEFNQVQLLLKNYLIEVENEYNFNELINPNLDKIFKKNSLLLKSDSYLKGKIYKYSNEFSFREDIIEILRYTNEVNNSVNNHISFTTCFLNFNYTSTALTYHKELNRNFGETFKLNNIHGSIENMVFGFGDETDNDYQLIENMNDNEYLENFKSFKYSLNSNYDNLFSFIESGKYQVYIMGHSCGLSDRVLLNSIFEHKNCRSIKIFYHEKEKGKDNYSSIVQNISRHFKDKAVMRRKIVNKTLCSPLPQNVRFKEK